MGKILGRSIVKVEVSTTDVRTTDAPQDPRASLQEKQTHSVDAPAFTANKHIGDV